MPPYDMLRERAMMLLLYDIPLRYYGAILMPRCCFSAPIALRYYAAADVFRHIDAAADYADIFVIRHMPRLRCLPCHVTLTPATPAVAAGAMPCAPPCFAAGY